MREGEISRGCRRKRAENLVQYVAVRIFATALLLPFAAVGARVTVAPMEVSQYLDTEVSTNVAVNVDSERRCEVAVRLAVDGNAASNCIQVAFGCDGDGNGILDFDEDETVYGWWAGRYFAESYPNRLRVYEAASDGAHCDFTVSLRLSKGAGLRKFAAVAASGAAVLTNLSAEAQSWLYSPRWNMMRVTRRGPGSPREWLTCDSRSHFMNVIVR